jgi:hypothetical protein
MLCFLATLAPGTATAQDANIDDALEQQSTTNEAAQQSQDLIDTLDDDIVADIGSNRAARQQINRLLIFNNNLDALIADQDGEIASIENQIADFGSVEQDVVPFMFEMIETLQRFIDLDMPFLQRERADRIARLEANMDRADLAVSEKYRQIMEAYQIETAYGRNIEAYVGALVIDGAERRVDILRVGRILLAYQTLDQAAVGFWDKSSGQWTTLDNAYRREISDGLRIARKQMAPRLLELPIPAAGAAQ